MKWILIIMLMYDRAPTIDHVEFNDFKSCEKAYRDVRERKGEYGDIHMVCVPKGKEPKQ